MQTNTTVAKTEQYNIVFDKGNSTLLLNWEKMAGLDIENFKEGIIKFAKHSQTYKPEHVLIDARSLDPDGDPLAWVSGHKAFANVEEYNSWWLREIVPAYHEARIVSLGVATGNPNAPGELPQVPPGANFKIGYFDDLDSVIKWQQT